MAGSSLRPGDRKAALAALGLFVLLALFGARFHWVEEAGTAERDGFVAQAEAIGGGALPDDPFRPPLYPLLIAALAPLTALWAPPAEAAFTAARLLSNLAAAALAWLAWFFASRLAARPHGGPPADLDQGGGGDGGQGGGGDGGQGGGGAAGAWAMAMVAVNPNLWILGQHVTTDMLYAALAAAALAAGLVYLQRPGTAAALAAGALYGLAAFTRGNALFLLPPLLAAFWLAGSSAGSSRGTARRRWRDLAVGAAAAVLVLVPAWWLEAAAFGSPLHDENWKNVALKVDGQTGGSLDWSYLERVPYDGPGELLAARWPAILTGGFEELGRFAIAGFAQLTGTWLHAALLLAGLAALAWLAAGRRPGGERGDAARPPVVWLLGSALFIVAATAFTFFTWGRLLLLLLPVAVGGGVAGLFALQRRPAARDLGPVPIRRLAAIGLTLLVASLAAKTFLFRLPAFVERHPYTEVRVLRELDRSLPPGTPVAGTSPFLGRYLERRSYLAIPDAFGHEIEQPGRYLERLRELLATAGASRLVIGGVDLRSRPATLLGPDAPAPWLRPAPEVDARPTGDQRRHRVMVWSLPSTRSRAPAAPRTEPPADR